MKRISATEGARRVRLLQGLVALVVATGLLMAGCKRDPDGQLPAVSGEAIQGKREAVQGFALVAAYPDQKGDEPLAIVLEFSRPLVGSQSFDELLAVTDSNGAVVKGSWVLSDDAKVLRFPHVEASRDYVVTIKAGVTAAAGDRLGQELRKQVHTGPLDPVVGFASQGSVLPARESRGLPVVSVNVGEVDVEFLRVRDKELPQFFAQYQRGGRRGSWELGSEYSEKTPLERLAEPVYVNRFVLGGKPNERVLTYLPVQEIKELQQPGLYFAVMKRAGQFQDRFETAFFTVSDLGLHARAYKNKLFVHAASLQKGAAVGGVELKVLDGNGEPVMKGETDGNGNVLLGYKLDAAHVLVARRGNDVSMLPFNQPALDLSEFAVSGREQAWFDVFAWSGRDLYRPGETARVSALLRDQDGQPLAAKGKALQPLFLRYVQPDGKTFLETRLQPDAQGYVRHAQLIPADAATGRWRVEFRTDPGSKDAVQGMTLRIEEFLPERLKLDLDAQPVLKPGEPLRLSVDGAYLYGAPAAGNRFTAKLAVAVEQHPLQQLPGYFFGDPTMTLPKEAKDVIDAKLDAQGRLKQDIALPEEVKPVSTIATIVTGSVYESGGRSVNRSLKRVLWPAEALVGVRPLFDDKEGSDANANAGFELARVGNDGKPRPGKGLRVTLVREHRDYHWNHDDDGGWNYDFTRRFEGIQARTVDAGCGAGAHRLSGGVGRLPCRRLRPGDATDHSLSVHRRLELERRQPRPRRAPGQGQARAGQDRLPGRRHAEGDADAAARRQGPADGRERPHALRAGHRGQGRQQFRDPGDEGLGAPRRLRDRAGVPRRQRAEQDHAGACGRCRARADGPARSQGRRGPRAAQSDAARARPAGDRERAATGRAGRIRDACPRSMSASSTSPASRCRTRRRISSPNAASASTPTTSTVA